MSEFATNRERILVVKVRENHPNKAYHNIVGEVNLFHHAKMASPLVTFRIAIQNKTKTDFIPWEQLQILDVLE